MDVGIDIGEFPQDIMHLGRREAAWNPYRFDPRKTLQSWCKNHFPAPAADFVFDAFWDTDKITDDLILDENRVGSFQIYHFFPNQGCGYSTPLEMPAALARVTEENAENWKRRFEIHEARAIARRSMENMAMACRIISEMRGRGTTNTSTIDRTPEDRPVTDEHGIKTLYAGSAATWELVNYFTDYHLALLHTRQYLNRPRKGRHRRGASASGARIDRQGRR